MTGQKSGSALRYGHLHAQPRRWSGHGPTGQTLDDSLVGSFFFGLRWFYSVFPTPYTLRTTSGFFPHKAAFRHNDHPKQSMTGEKKKTILECNQNSMLIIIMHQRSLHSFLVIVHTSKCALHTCFVN